MGDSDSTPVRMWQVPGTTVLACELSSSPHPLVHKDLQSEDSRILSLPRDAHDCGHHQSPWWGDQPYLSRGSSRMQRNVLVEQHPALQVPRLPLCSHARGAMRPHQGPSTSTCTGMLCRSSFPGC